MRYYFLTLLLLIPYLLQAQLKFSTQYGNKELTFKQNTAKDSPRRGEDILYLWPRSKV